MWYYKCIHDILCWETFFQLIIDIGYCLWIMPLHHMNSVLKQSSSKMNIFTNVRVNTMHHDWNPSTFEFHIFPTQFLNQHPTYGSQYMISHSKGYDTYKDIIHVRNLKIHVHMHLGDQGFILPLNTLSLEYHQNPPCFYIHKNDHLLFPPC